MPVYNEEQVIEEVVSEWFEHLNTINVDFCFCILNDGSTDSSLQKLEILKKKHPQIVVVDKKNTGHGQTCVVGYHYALEHGFQWVLQVDSDGQCDPAYLKTFIEKVANTGNLLVYGNRVVREDGWKRKFISKFVSIFAYVATGIWVKDANVPFRLMHHSCLKEVLSKIPKNFHLANVLLSVVHKKYYEVSWIAIRFRNRLGGVPSVKSFSFVKHGWKLFWQLRSAFKQ